MRYTSDSGSPGYLDQHFNTAFRASQYIQDGLRPGVEVEVLPYLETVHN